MVGVQSIGSALTPATFMGWSLESKPQFQEYAEEVARVGIGAVRRTPRARFQVRLRTGHPCRFKCRFHRTNSQGHGQGQGSRPSSPPSPAVTNAVLRHPASPSSSSGTVATQ
uniref:Uncharacterized protein n=1 Tax=Aegilops tauschii TaxID=37682 RepID=M8CC43_AEGTA